MGCVQHSKTFPARFVNQTKALSPMLHWSYTLKGFTLGRYPLCHTPSAKKFCSKESLKAHNIIHIGLELLKKAKNGAELGSQKVCKRKTRQECTSKTDTT